MSLPVEEREIVECDLQNAARFLRRYSSVARVREFLQAVHATYRLLGEFPELGRTRADLPEPNLRSFGVRGFPKWLIFYRPAPEKVEIWRVLHGARDLDRELADLP